MRTKLEKQMSELGASSSDMVFDIVKGRREIYAFSINVNGRCYYFQSNKQLKKALAALSKSAEVISVSI